jgi:uncharacterized membrane protein YecN with MAPEG domain
MPLQTVPIYAALLGVLFVLLSVRAIGARRAARVAIGPLGQDPLDRRVRAHANCAEYVPLALLLLAFAELRGAPGLALHAGGLALLLGRAAHAWGLSNPPENYRWRVGGMAATFAAYGIAVAALAAGYLLPKA